jgi:hypothetical protein
LPQPEARGDEAKMWSARVAVEGGYLGKQGWRAGGNMLLRYWRIGLAADAHYYTGRSRAETMYLGSANWTIDIVMRPHLGLRFGPGIMAKVDAQYPRGGRPSYELGPGMMTEIDIFPIHPVVGSLRFDYGRIGDSAAMSGRASVGVLVRRLEIYLAYEAKLIGATPLRGPQLGLRAWF